MYSPIALLSAAILSIGAMASAETSPTEASAALARAVKYVESSSLPLKSTELIKLERFDPEGGQSSTSDSGILDWILTYKAKDLKGTDGYLYVHIFRDASAKRRWGFWKLSVSFDKAHYALVESPRITVTVTNVGPEEEWLPVGRILADYEVTVARRGAHRGTILGISREALTKSIDGGAWHRSIAPGKSYEVSEDLRAAIDNSTAWEPGEYSVRVDRRPSTGRFGVGIDGFAPALGQFTVGEQ